MKLAVSKNKLVVRGTMGSMEIFKSGERTAKMHLWRSGVLVFETTHPLEWYKHKRQLKKYIRQVAAKWLNPRCRLVKYTSITKSLQAGQPDKVEVFHFVEPRDTPTRQNFSDELYVNRFVSLD
ncbi:MAG: hypothetical protein PHQ58_04710 [Rhodoferax sp.]|uniref:hypothetical protein n=1 Tax=Rhodoferax sp. TaxID=50421 RepID=UPI0026227552|nr:hypothetical protein [Rhodoferax sp.]MDD2879714.1 hypothetical protein [Rhodoferax sp.]